MLLPLKADGPGATVRPIEGYPLAAPPFGRQPKPRAPRKRVTKKEPAPTPVKRARRRSKRTMMDSDEEEEEAVETEEEEDETDYSFEDSEEETDSPSQAAEGVEEESQQEEEVAEETEEEEEAEKQQSPDDGFYDTIVVSTPLRWRPPAPEPPPQPPLPAREPSITPPPPVIVSPSPPAEPITPAPPATTRKRPRFSSLDPPLDTTPAVRKLPRRSAARRRSTRQISPTFLDALSTEVTPSTSQKRAQSRRISPFLSEITPRAGSVSITPLPEAKGKGEARKEVDIAPTPSSHGGNSRHHTETQASPVVADAPESARGMDLVPLPDGDDESSSLLPLTVVDFRKKDNRRFGELPSPPSPLPLLHLTKASVLEDPSPPASDEVADTLFNALNSPTSPPQNSPPPSLPPASGATVPTSARVCTSASQSSISAPHQLHRCHTGSSLRLHDPFRRHLPAADALAPLSPPHRESISRWKDASRSEGTRFSGPRMFTPLTQNRPTGGCGLVVLPQRMSAEMERRRERYGSSEL